MRVPVYVPVYSCYYCRNQERGNFDGCRRSWAATRGRGRCRPDRWRGKHLSTWQPSWRPAWSAPATLPPTTISRVILPESDFRVCSSNISNGRHATSSSTFESRLAPFPGRLHGSGSTGEISRIVLPTACRRSKACYTLGDPSVRLYCRRDTPMRLARTTRRKLAGMFPSE